MSWVIEVKEKGEDRGQLEYNVFPLQLQRRHIGDAGTNSRSETASFVEDGSQTEAIRLSGMLCLPEALRKMMVQEIHSGPFRRTSRNA